MIAQAVAVREAVRRLQTLRDLDRVALFRRAGFDPDPWQADLLRSDASQILMLCSRQSGKSTVAAAMAVHEALCRPPALVLLVAPALRQSQELLRKVKELLAGLGDVAPVPREASALRLEFASGSRIIALPGNEAKIRGFSAPSLVIEDEAARCPDELYVTLRPMLATSRGRLVLLSSPWGKRGHFYREWTDGGERWHRATITADACPRIDPTWLAHERASMPELVFRQEYLCEFVETEDTLFDYEHIHRMLSSNGEPLLPGGRFFV